MGPIDELTRQVAELRVRLGAAEAVQALQNLKARYAQLVDERYVRGKVAPEERVAAVAEQIAALFTEDGVWDGGPALGVSTGRKEIAARMRAPTLVFSWHFFLKPQIHVDGDRARARWDILSPCTTKDGRPHWMVGFEDDEYRREGDAWLHTRMKLTSVFLAPHETGWQKIFY
jgi:SnoaL-like domain